MDLINLKIKDFIEQVDSDSPAPGGGSVSALMSVLGVSLSRMVGHLSIDKKKFLKLDETIQEEFKNCLNKLNIIKDKLIPLIDADTKSFNMIMKAYGFPKVTDEEIELRSNLIEEATIEAIRVPFEVANLSLEALEVFGFILKYGNKQTVSDLGVATLAVSSGIEGAIYNIMINLSSLKDKNKIKIYKKESKELLDKSYKYQDQILEDIYELLKIEY